MKKLFLLFMIAATSATFGFSQLGMPQWVFPGSNPKVFDVAGASVSNLPQGPNSVDYQGAVPERTYANFTDDDGNVNFFVVDDAIYDADGYLIADFQLTTETGTYQPWVSDYFDPTLESDIGIVNVPGACDKYYIVLVNNADFPNAIPREGFYYLTLDMSAPNRHYPSRSGALTGQHFTSSYGVDFFYARPILLNTATYGNPNERKGGYSISFTQPLNNQRFMYLAGQNDIEQFTVTAWGFTRNNYTLDQYYGTSFDSYDLFKWSGGNGDLVDSDIIKLTNGNYKLAVTLRPGSGGWPDNPNWNSQRIYGVVATINGQTGQFSNVEGLKFPTPSGSDNRLVRGIEFSHNARYVYASYGTAPYLFYFDLQSTPTNGYYTYNGLSLSNSANFKRGNIEKGLNGKIYFASAGGLGSLANSNSPTSTWNASAHSFTISNRYGYYGDFTERGYIIPKNLNNENYDHQNLIDAAIIVDAPGCPGVEYEAYLLSEIAVAGTWSNGQAGTPSATYVSETGLNTVYIDIVNDFGCIERISTSFEIEPVLQLQLNASSTVYCPKNGPITIDYQVAFAEPGNRINYATWTKNGDFYSSNVNSITPNGPGLYCLRVEDDFTGCLSEEYCIEITEGTCTTVDPSFNFTMDVLKTTYTVDVYPTDLRPCTSHGWWVLELTASGPVIVHGAQWMTSGTLNFTFDIGKEYIIKHGIDSPCALYTTLDRNVSQSNKMAPEASVDLYPNPAQHSVRIDTELDFADYEVRNPLGQTVLLGQDRELDVTGLDAGLYFVTLRDATGQRLQTVKLVKE